MATRAKMKRISAVFDADLAVVIEKQDEKWQAIVTNLRSSHEEEMVVLRHEYQAMADERVAIIEAQRVEIDELNSMLTPLQVERREDTLEHSRVLEAEYERLKRG